MQSRSDNVPGLVSVVIPTFNRAGLLEQSIRSALAQDYPNKEIIVIDDSSTDDTVARVRAIGGVEYYRQSNAGPSAARNHGLRHCRGEYVTFLDSDDLWSPNFLSQSVKGLELTSGGFVFANWQGIGEDGSISYPDKFATRPHLKNYLSHPVQPWNFLSPEKVRHLFVRHAAAPPSATVIRRRIIAGGWDEKARVGEDRLFLVDAIFTFQCSAAFTLMPLWSHRVHCANAHAGNPNRRKIVLGDIYVKERILEKYGRRLTATEAKIIQRSIAKDYLDLGYFESQQGHRRVALRSYYHSWRLNRQFKPLLAMGKALVRNERSAVASTRGKKSATDPIASR